MNQNKCTKQLFQFVLLHRLSIKANNINNLIYIYFAFCILYFKVLITISKFNYFAEFNILCGHVGIYIKNIIISTGFEIIFSKTIGTTLEID